VGAVELDGESVEFGVLAYEDDDVSHFIVGGLYDGRPTLTAQIVDNLLAAGAIADEELVLEIIGLAKPASVDDKLGFVVDIVEATVSEAHRTLQEQVRQIQASIEALLSHRTTPEVDILSSFAPDRPSFSLLPIHAGGIRDLVVLRGIAHGADHDEHVNIHASAAAFPIIVRLQGLTQHPTLSAHLVRSGRGRVPLIIVGLGHSISDFEEITLPPVAPTLGDAYGAHWPEQQTFDLHQHPLGRKSSPRRRIRFRITR
jgi:hypothetical protein